MIKKYNEMNEDDNLYSMKDIVKLIVKFKKQLEQYKTYNHSIDDLSRLNLSDEDSFSMGEISGNIETLTQVISELENLIGNK